MDAKESFLTIVRKMRLTSTGVVARVVMDRRYPPSKVKTGRKKDYPINVRFQTDESMDQDIRRVATEHGVSRAEAMRLLITWGLESMGLED